MVKDFKIFVGSFALLGLGYYYYSNTIQEIVMDIIIIVSVIAGLFLFLRWGKTFTEELGKRGDRGIENLINPTPISEYASSNPTREFTDQPRNDHDYTAKSSTEASTMKSERIEVTESKVFEVVKAVTEFMTNDTKGGKLWLDATNPVNHNLIKISLTCKVHKAVIVAVIKRYPDEFKITTEYDKKGKEQQFAYSVTAFDTKQRETQERKNSTEVVFESTTPTTNSIPRQQDETRKETVYA